MSNVESKTLWLSFDEEQRSAIKTISFVLRWPEAQVVLESIDASLDLIFGNWPTGSAEAPSIILLFEGFKMIHAKRKKAVIKKWTSLCALSNPTQKGN